MHYLKLTIGVLICFIWPIFSFPWKFWATLLGGKYWSFTFLVYVCICIKLNPLVMDSAKYALYAKCLEAIDIPLLNPGSMSCLNEMQCPLKAKINPH